MVETTQQAYIRTSNDPEDETTVGDAVIILTSSSKYSGFALCR